MSYGLLAGLTDPEVMARIAARERAAERIAEQFFMTHTDAIKALRDFESDLSHKGHTLH